MTNLKDMPELIVLDLTETMPDLINVVADLLNDDCEVGEVLKNLFEFLKYELMPADVEKIMRIGYRFPEIAKDEATDGIRAQQQQEQINVFMRLLEEIRSKIYAMDLVSPPDPLPYRFLKVFATNSMILVREDLGPMHDEIFTFENRPTERVWKTTFGQDLEYRVG